jgi:hypothetical protein
MRPLVAHPQTLRPQRGLLGVTGFGGQVNKPPNGDEGAYGEFPGTIREYADVRVGASRGNSWLDVAEFISIAGALKVEPEVLFGCVLRW